VQHLGRRVTEQPLGASVPADDQLPIIDHAEPVGAIAERAGKPAKWVGRQTLLSGRRVVDSRRQCR
jgi:hypothetical protein